MLTIETFFTRSHLFGQLRNIIDMSHSRNSHAKDNPPKSLVPPAKARRRARRITRPEPGSLYDIMREHCGTSLFVPPICWTDLHAELLGARFVGLDPVVAPVPRLSSQGSWNSSPPSQIAQSLSRDLTALLSPAATQPFVRTRAIKDIMGTLFPATFSKPKSFGDLRIFFGGRVFRKAVRLPVMWKCPNSPGTSFDSAATRPSGASFGATLAASCSQSPSSSPSGVMVAYISRTHLAAIRRNLFRVAPGPEDGDRFNTPVSRLQQLRSKHLVPADADHDAYYLSILIAMAQSFLYDECAGSKSSSQQSSYRPAKGAATIVDMLPASLRDVRVQLIVQDEDAAEFVVYTAVVTAAFLERFARPTKAPRKTATTGGECGDGGDGDATAGIDISFARVPVWPVLGLKERLSKALGRETVGDVVPEDDDDEIETWETEEERRQRLGGSRLKRGRSASDHQREVLAEVLNSSFEVEDDISDDHPVLSPDAKRRCTRPVNALEVC